MGFQGIGKVVILGGIFPVFPALLLFFWQKIPFLGKLPGDVFVHRGDPQFSLPMVSSIIISIVFTIILNLIIRLFR
jgi:hypothetical protein